MAYLVSIATLPCPGERECGDIAAFWQADGSDLFCIIDGLGHGIGAAQAARKALSCVCSQMLKPLDDVFLLCNEELKSSRGVAMGVAIADPDRQRLIYGGIGNTRAMIVHQDGRTQRLSSNNGILGAGYHPFTSVEVVFAPGDTLFLFTDGLPEMLELDNVTPDMLKDPARHIWNIFNRWKSDRDDAGLLICHHTPDRFI